MSLSELFEEQINYSAEQGVRMFDALSRTAEGRAVQPLDHFDNIDYRHRYYYDSYNLMLGDVFVMVPPDWIYVSSASFSQRVQTLRQENSQKEKTGYHKREIHIHLCFNGMDEINGYKVPAPKHSDGNKVSEYYYVDGLRPLLAQFKSTPFIPVTNELLNEVYGIYTVSLNDIIIRSIDGFQNALSCELVLQEINMMPYIEMPDIMYQFMIDWDLYRAYTQSFLTENYVYKNLQSLPENRDHTAFKMSILNESVLSNVTDDLNGTSKEESILKLIVDDNNYETLIDSNDTDIHITNFECGYSNTLTSIQMSDQSTPTLQYLGGMDTLFNITFETTSKEAITAIEQCQIKNDLMVRNNPKIRGSIGFVKLDSDFVAFCGSSFVFIENVETATAQGIPGLYTIKMSCVSYDIVQSRREELEGFLPFIGKECSLEDLKKSGDQLKEAIGLNEHQAIGQSYQGLMAKIYQDNYAEWKLRTTMEVYPDLRLPTYLEVNDMIININEFRVKNKLDPLPYNKYPIPETNMLFGIGQTKLKYPNHWLDEWGDGPNYMFQEHIENLGQYNDHLYNGFVDPDFYVFYPHTYLSNFLQELKEKNDKENSTGEEGATSNITRDPLKSKNGSATYETKIHANYGAAAGDHSTYDDVTGFIAHARRHIGCKYVFKGEGSEDTNQPQTFDSFGLVTRCLKEMGKIPADQKILDVKTLQSQDIFEQVDTDSVKLGDILVTNMNYCGILSFVNDKYKKIITVNKKEGVHETDLSFKPVKAFRVKALYDDYKKPGTSESNKYKNESDQYPDANGQIQKKKKSALSKAGSYNSENEYGADSSDELEATSTVDNGDGTQTVTITNEEQIKKNEIERRNQDNLYNSLKKETAEPKLNQADISELELPEPEDDGSKWNGGKVKITETKTLTNEEFDSFARVIATNCEGEKLDCKMAMAQLLYDQLTDPRKTYSGASTIAENATVFKEDKKEVEKKELNDAKSCLKKVFQQGYRWKKNYRVLRFCDVDNGNFAAPHRNEKYGDKIGSAGRHIFYGYKEKGATIGYNIKGYGVSEASNNNVTVERKINVNVKELIKVKRFGHPIYIKSKYFDSHDYDRGRLWQMLSSNEIRLLTSFVDECQYSGKGRLVRAFPTFLLCILDDQAQWYDGRKLWTNYYVYRPVVDINFHAANDMPTATATITVTNTFHNLDRSSNILAKHSIQNDEDYDGINRWLYKNMGFLIGGQKITSRLIQLHSMIYNHTKVREGGRVHLRIGYGSDPMSLAPIINGTISSVELGDQISIVVTSDGHELIQNITSDTQDDLNNGLFGTGIGATDEASDIIAEILYARESWVNHLMFMGDFFEGNKYNIEHFGLYINSSDEDIFQGGIDAGILDQYDLLMNLYTGTTDDAKVLGMIKVGTFKHLPYYYYADEKETCWDGEESVVFNQYNMTPWDVFQTCTQATLEFTVKAEMYQFDSRLFFGLPFDLTKYRYDIINGSIYQEVKSNTQVHFIDSVFSIIENQLSVTSARTFTNAKVMYTRGGTPTTTSVIHSDDTIDFSKQSTHIIDSPIAQDYLGPDALYSFVGSMFGIGKWGEDCARRLGISNLLQGWQQQYNGQILCLGAPSVKPEDYLMVCDFYSTLNGLTMVREVIHSFNNRSGFTTSIIPGIIGFSPEAESGNVYMIMNLFKLYESFAGYAQDRKITKEQTERFNNIIANMYHQITHYYLNKYAYLMPVKAMNQVTKMGEVFALTTTFINTIRTIKNSESFFKGVKNVYGIMKAAHQIADAHKLFKGTRTVYHFIKGINTMKNGINVASTVKDGILVAGAAGAPETCGISIAIALLVDMALNLLFDGIERWLMNRNTVILLPMWWEGEPFISGIKDGEKILLIPAEGDGTEENTGEEGHDTNEDKTTTVEDN